MAKRYISHSHVPGKPGGLALCVLHAKVAKLPALSRGRVTNPDTRRTCNKKYTQLTMLGVRRISPAECSLLQPTLLPGGKVCAEARVCFLLVQADWRDFELR